MVPILGDLSWLVNLETYLRPTKYHNQKLGF